MKKCFKKIPIEFHLSNYKLIFVFIFPICEIINTKIREKYLQKNYEFFITFSTYLSYLFSFIFIIIIKLRTQNQNTENESIDDKINDEEKSNGIIDIEIKKIEKTKKLKNLICILILSGINMCFSHFNYESYHGKRTIGLSYKIIMFFLLSHFLLKYNYDKLHYITFVINVITLIIKYSITIIVTDSKQYVGKHIWFYFVYALSFCLFFIVGKYYIDNYYQTPYFILLSIGIIISSILIIIALIKYWAGYESQIFAGFSDNVNTTKNVFLFLGDIITQFGMYLGLWITVYYFTVCHTIISENIMEIGYYIIDFQQNETLWEGKKIDLNIHLYPYIHIINLICSLIFNEIIILRFCGLDYSTNLRIQEREIEDSKKIIKMIEKIDGDSNDISGISS